jgi:2'-5' RNA ligase
MTESATSHSVRLFLAISVPEQVKVEMVKAQEELNAIVGEGGIRWTHRGQLHLTLKFLGNVEPHLASAVGNAISSVCENFERLRLRAAGIGFFPDAGFPRIIWAGVGDEKQELADLQQALQQITRPFTKEEPEQNFIGHVTLGRVKRLSKQQTKALAKAGAGLGNRFFGEWQGDCVELIRSELSSDGPRYSTLASARLGLA